ncbi:MAG: hypothetical protein ACHQFX_04455 [Chitinophagales bacterium]
MKKFVIVVLTILALGSATFGQARKFNNMVGLWEMVGEQESGGGLQIVDSATILIRFMGEEKTILSYNIDFSKSPYWFDFSCKDTTSISHFKSLIEFVGDDTLKWQIFTEGERADHFTSRTGELFYLKRARPKTNTTYYTGN